MSTLTRKGGGGGTALPVDGHAVLDEGSLLPQRSKLDFVGTGVSAIDDPTNDKTIVTIASGGNLAYGKPYTFSPAAHASYTDPSPAGNQAVNGVWASSGQKLTDGIASSTFNDGNTVAWNAGTSVVIRVDLGAASAVARITAKGWHGALGMYRPTGIVVESSPDDSTWTTRATHTGLTSGGPGLARFRMDETFAAVSARTLTRDTDMLLMDELEIAAV